MLMQFWGVRGSVPFATPGSIGHGCNTACVEVRNPRTDDVLILDAGSGIVGLSQALGSAPRDVPLLLTHYHWDHTQGLPFFEAFYRPAWHATIYAPRLRAIDGAWVEAMFDPRFYPVPYQALPSQPTMSLFDAGDVAVTAFSVRALPLNHPGGSFAYRIRGDHGDLVYATDHEFGNPEYDEPFGEFARGARVLILDSHFTPDEIPSHRGWGHSCWRQCAEFAASHQVGDLRLFHHKPGRSDVELTLIESYARRIFEHTCAAREGDFVEF